MHPLPLGVNGELQAQIQKGEQFLPLNAGGHPERLSEDEDLGDHRFFFWVEVEAIELPTENAPPTPCEHNRVHSVAVQVIA